MILNVIFRSPVTFILGHTAYWTYSTCSECSESLRFLVRYEVRRSSKFKIIGLGPCLCRFEKYLLECAIKDWISSLAVEDYWTKAIRSWHLCRNWLLPPTPHSIDKKNGPPSYSVLLSTCVAGTGLPMLADGREGHNEETSARIYRPSFRENKPKPLVFFDCKRAFWACFRENWIYKFGHMCMGFFSIYSFLRFT
jgi:hypothetical protein